MKQMKRLWLEWNLTEQWNVTDILCAVIQTPLPDSPFADILASSYYFHYAANSLCSLGISVN